MKIPDLIIKFRLLIIIVFVISALVLGGNIRNAQIDPDIINQIPEDMPSRIQTDKIEEIFGGIDMSMILVSADDVLDEDTLRWLKTVSKKVNRIKGVDKVLSLFDLKSITGENGAMVVEPAVMRIPKNRERREELRKELIENDMVFGSVVSKDFKTTCIIALLKNNASDELIVSEIQKIIAEHPFKGRIVLGGLPNTRMQVSKTIQRDLRVLMPIGLFIMLLFLYACFRQLRGVVLPFLVVIMSIMVALGLIPLLGWKIQVITILLPIILIAIANDYGIHMIAKYQELNFKGNTLSKEQLAKDTFSSLTVPVLFTGLTTVGGMLCLLWHIVIPAKRLGILAAVGITFALTASLFFIPAVLSYLPKTKQIVDNETKSGKVPILERLLLHFSNFVSSRPKTVIGISVILFIAASIGIFFIKIDTDPMDFYPENSEVVKAAEIINKEFGGIHNISVMYKGDIKDPALMKKMDALEKKMQEIPEVGITQSLAKVIRTMSRALNNEGDKDYDSIPDSRNAIAQYLELYSMSGDPEDFEKIVDFPYEHALVTARIKTTSTPKISRIQRDIEEFVKGDEHVELIGGFGTILASLARQIVNGQLISLGIAILLIGLLIMLLFRSVIAGLLSSIPLAISVVLLFGLMGIFGITLNMATVMISSIMIGVGVDYTIHFLWRYRKERRSGMTPEDAVRKTLTTTGRGIIFNAFSVIVGFVVLFISGFLPVKFFGFLVTVSIFSCLLGALILIPSLCLLLRPRFLEPLTGENHET